MSHTSERRSGAWHFQSARHLGSNWGREAALVAVLFLLAFGPRALALDHFLTGDELDWVKWSSQFLAALLRGDLAASFPGWAAPAVTTRWTGAIGLALYAWRRGLPLAEFLDSIPYPAPPELMPAVRLPTVLLAALCVVAVYWLSRRLFGAGVGLVAAILLAFDPFYLAHSRFIHHDALVATFMIVSALSLLVHFGRQADGRRSLWRSLFYLVLSGLCAGLAFLTKSTAAFLLPFWGVAALLHQRRGAVRQFVIWSLVAALVVLALWPALWVDPLGTIKAVWDIASTATLAPHAKGTFLFGQARADPGPLFYPVSFLFRSTPPVLLGLAALAFAWARGQVGERRRAALALLLYAAGFALLVTVGHKKGDRYLLPIFPAVDVLAAFGLCNLFRVVCSRFKSIVTAGTEFMEVKTKSLRVLCVLCGSVCLALQAAFALLHFPYYITYYDPLVGGGRLAPWALLVGWGEGLDEAARYLNAKPDPERLEVAVWYSRQFKPFFRGQTVDLFDAEPTLGADYAVFYVNQTQRRLPLAGLVDYFQRRRAEHVVRLAGIDYAWIYRGPVVGFEPPTQIAHPVSGTFGGQAQLLGYELRPARVESGGECHVTLYWRALAEMGESYNVYLRLADEEGHLWGQVDRLPVMGYWATDRWQPGTFVVDEYDLEVLPGTPPGEYVLRAGLYSFQTGRTLEAVGEAGRGPDLALGRVLVVRPKVFPRTDDLAMQHALEQKMGDEIVLLGHDFEGGEVQPGEVLAPVLYWRAEVDVKGDYTVALRLLDGSGRVWAEKLNRPRYPTTAWQKGEIVRDRQKMAVSGRVPGGDYQLAVALLKVPSTLEVPGTWEEEKGRATLGTVTVQERARNFEPPPIAHPVRANLGGVAELLGYEAAETQLKAGQTLNLRLYWRALNEVDVSYTVFVHLLDSSGRIWGQRDRPPMLPTTGWVKGEIIADHYRLEISPDAPPGEYLIEVGLYDSIGGARLPVLGESGEDRVLLGRVRVR